MSEITEGQPSKALMPTEVKQPTTADLANAIFTLVSANAMSREEFVLALDHLLEKEGSSSYEYGLLQGYAIAEELGRLRKRKPQPKAIAKISQILMNNPNATTEMVFLALDNAEIPLRKSKSVSKHVRLWSDVVDEPYYKVLVSRMRKQVERVVRLREWQREIDLREMQSGLNPRTLI